MAPSVEISIPKTQISNTTKPYTVYDISLRLPLRSFTVQKRYSDFTALHSALASQAGAPPPATLPQKSWFSRTTSNPGLTEERRKGLESYLRTINEVDDARWRSTSAWRSFLNLPVSTNSNTASVLHSAITTGTSVTDPVVWLDCHRDLKSLLYDARLQLTRRDQAASAQAQHECSAQAKKSLVRAGTMIITLERGLKEEGWDLGDGEIRRRKDLVGSAKKEKEGLEDLLNAMVAKSQLDKTVASVADKTALVGKASKQGRVLGKETSKTRELDNQGVLQLQKQLMEEQDLDVEELAKVVRRQRELGVAIQEELAVQKDMLELLDEDVTRVSGKVDVVRKRVDQIR
ncbi:Target SNARE coiled-coil domain [Lasallia pustulata]|uniref:Target SNARE coiled-coil domain n=1 Tax=Lasallia pustulata TaxID=136370 RepID=A0A1W5D2F5_9LECA|nr:Target SNARE coiled-coil domain [Lasallia pustulata]